MSNTWPESSTLGEIIRRQRELASLPMRQLAAMAGISNPYLSQIERGLREPSEHVLHAIADSLQVSAETLRSTDEDDAERVDGAAGSAVLDAIQADADLTPQQRRALQETYEAFREVTIERRRAKGRQRRT
ncbi:helix-turn-helix domain-containing protein [Nakamurella deserti]|uniref:helix-turn-helix domain-containing protein n=1 Tax=Nakamurella deserti TaxID=2164074 RepID=UPI000DBEA7EA|nr:helix-turn-helix transcriptional regulator [Nakamurella deserti]